MDTTFYGTLKLITGEEVLAQITPSEENGVEFFILSDPIVVENNQTIDDVKGVAYANLVPRKWLQYSGEDLSIVYKDKVLTVSELDMFGIDFYKNALVVARVSSPLKKKVKTDSHHGYLGSIEDARTTLERIFNSTSDEIDQGELNDS